MEKKQFQETYVERYRVILSVFGFIVFFVGIYLGKEFPMQILKETYQNTTLTVNDYMYDTQFNWLLASAVWGSSTLLIFLFNILVDILNELRKLNNKSK